MLNRTNIVSTLLLLTLAACSTNGGTGGGGGGGTTAGAEGQKFFLPTGAKIDNTGAPSLEVDAQGNTHSANDKPRVVYTLDYGVGMFHCDDAQCGAETSNRGLTKVELGSDLPADQIFLNTNCTVGGWFFHSPSIALTSDGHPRVGYQARDLSGGFGHTDTPKSDCVAGTDMTWSRVAILSSDQ